MAKASIPNDDWIPISTIATIMLQLQSLRTYKYIMRESRTAVFSPHADLRNSATVNTKLQEKIYTISQRKIL